MAHHDRFMRFAGVDYTIFKIIENSQVLPGSIDSGIGKYLEESFGKLKASNLCKSDLELLRLLLCQLYKFNYESAKNYSIKHSIEFNQLIVFLKNSDLCTIKENQSVLYDIIVLYLVLLVDQRNFILIFEDFQSNHTKTLFQDGDKLSTDVYLKLLNCFLSAWEVLYLLHQKKGLDEFIDKTHLESCKKVLLSSVLHDVQTLVNCNEYVEWHGLQSALSKIVSISQNIKILSPYMDEILHEDVALTTLCALSDFIFPTNSFGGEPDYCLIHNVNLLKAIQNNLHSECHQNRKEALYLLKKMIDFINMHEETLRTVRLETCLKLIPSAINPFICNKTEPNCGPIDEIRTNLVLILEALEEKQKHLVVPSLGYLEPLIKGVLQHRPCGNCFDLNWLYCVFASLLKHSNGGVVKWGLIRAIILPINYFNDAFLKLIISALPHTYLYDTNHPDLDIPRPLTTLLKNLQKRTNNQMIENFLYYIGQVQWGPVPIFYVLQCLYNASKEFDNILQWEEEPLHTIKLLVSQNIILHPPLIRSMSHVQLIQLFCNTNKINNMKNLINFISVFPEEDLKEALSLPSLRLCLAKIEVIKVAKFVKSICNDLKADDQKVVIRMSTFAFVIELLYESGVIDKTNECSVAQDLKDLILCLDKIDVRPYINLSLITKIMDFVNGFFGWKCDGHPNCIKIIFNSLKATVFNFILKLFHNEAFKYDDIDVYSKTLDLVFNISYVSVDSKVLKIKCEQVVNNAAQHSTAQLLFALKSWSEISHNHKYADKPFMQMIKNVLEAGKSDRHRCEITGKAGLDFYSSICKLIKNHVLTLNSDDLKRNYEWLEISSIILDASGNEVLIYLCDIVKKYSTVVLEDTTRFEELKFLIRHFWACNFGSKRQKTFWLVAQKLTECINTSEFLLNQPLLDISKDYIYRMLLEGESMPGLKYILLTCSDITLNFKHFIEVLLNGLFHGQVYRRDQRIYMQACLSGKNLLNVYELKDDKLENFNAHEFLSRQCNVDVAVRAAAVVQLCKAMDENANNANIFLPFVLEKLFSFQGKRYYADSQIHRIKHRIMQTLLLLQPYLSFESTTILYHTLRDSIIRDSDQHSVRLMKEWLIMRIYSAHENLLSDFWPFFDRICEERPNSTISLIDVAWHIAQHLREEKLENFVYKLLPKLAVCCMGHQFSMRLYGQVFFVKIYELLQNHSSLRKEYFNLYTATMTSLNSNTFKKNPIKIEEDFFYTAFNPQVHYSLETIYHQLPRLCNVSFEEFITDKNFEEQLYATKSYIDRDVENCNKSLDEAVIPYSILKSTESPRPEEIEYSEVSTDIQKKMTSWRTMLPNEDELYQMTFSSNVQFKPRQTNDIIVVASLIDKPQNLGGIARTCEIFGAKELVISDFKQIEAREFQALSVSADKWIKMTEAKARFLSKYLEELKSSGWTVVGAEQTTNSVNLIDFKFPKQTALVLGNEKNGIPADIIPLLDVCVEIPQYGVIRSLNVHVTSAICIWEYNKQHRVSA